MPGAAFPKPYFPKRPSFRDAYETLAASEMRRARPARAVTAWRRADCRFAKPKVKPARAGTEKPQSNKPRAICPPGCGRGVYTPFIAIVKLPFKFERP